MFEQNADKRWKEKVSEYLHVYSKDSKTATVIIVVIIKNGVFTFDPFGKFQEQSLTPAFKRYAMYH